MRDRIIVAKIIAAHGVKGQVKLKAFTDNLANYAYFFDANGERLRLSDLRQKSPGFFTATLEGITDRDQAETLKSKELFIDKSQLPPLSDDEFYYEELVGKDAIVNDKKIGSVTGVFNFGAGDFLEIGLLSGKQATIHLSACEITADRVVCPPECLLT